MRDWLRCRKKNPREEARRGDVEEGKQREEVRRTEEKTNDEVRRTYQLRHNALPEVTTHMVAATMSW